ncbi:Inactive phospholipase D5 [Galemys pyrenaicus]|uniref:Inactive phospholipase D5 n=1 Tax=Galemys pyrenaicus TaxID=202257 RepID=A0A8J6DKW3_GALPY|nr:Inactive phospholipase D5 [Galemys pyrenaicus]
MRKCTYLSLDLGLYGQRHEDASTNKRQDQQPQQKQRENRRAISVGPHSSGVLMTLPIYAHVPHSAVLYLHPDGIINLADIPYSSSKSQQKCIVVFALVCCFAILVALIFSAVDIMGEDEDGLSEKNCQNKCR